MKKFLFCCLAIVGLATGMTFSSSVEKVEVAKKKVSDDHLSNISVTVVSSGGEGSGVLKTRKRGSDTITFVWTGAHVVRDLRKVKEVIDSRTGTSKSVVEFGWPKIVRSIVQNGETIGKSELVCEVIRYSAEEDLALLRVRMKNYTNDSVQFYLDDRIPGVRSKLVHVGSLLGELGSNSTTEGAVSYVGRMLNKKVYDQVTVTAFPGSCLPADMLVSMADGTSKKIVDVKSGDKVKVFDKEVCSGTVTAFLEAGRKPIFEVSTGARKLRASGNHPVVKVNHIVDVYGKVHTVPLWTRVDELKTGDAIAVMYGKDLMFEVVTSVKEGLTEPTYDITVDKVHNFFAEGVLVHNSGGGVYLDGDGRLVGLILRGAGETFNLMVPVRRMRGWAKQAQVEWAVDDRVPLPSEDDLKKLPIEDIGVSFTYAASGKKSFGSGPCYLGELETQYPTLFKLYPTFFRLP